MYKSKNYTVSDIATTFGVSERTVQRWVETLVFKEKNKVLIPEDVFELLKTRHGNDIIATEPDTENEFPIIEGFTEDEYQEYQKRLIEYPILKDQIEYLKKDILYHKKSIESHNRQMELLLLTITNSKFIEE